MVEKNKINQDFLPSDPNDISMVGNNGWKGFKMNVCIKIIPHKEQRYPTCGDWYYDKHGNLHIRISKMSDWRYEMCVAVHELVEVLICKHNGVSQKSVDKFDIAFEKKRKRGNTDEPGDSDRAPYRVQHGIASGVERILGTLLGISWNKYNDEINAL